MKPITATLLSLAALAGLGWAAVAIQPAPFPAYPQRPPPPETTPLPTGLPAPVERFYRQLYGDRVPVISSAVLTGQATMRIKGVTLPARFRFTHQAGQGYKHYFEVTLFGLPVMKANEHYLDGHGRMELPFGVDEGPSIDQGANLGMWAETLAWMPAALLTDPRVRWEPLDATTAILVVPFGDGEERFVARFDPDSGMLRLAEVMRHQGTAATKTLWLNETRAYGQVGGHTVTQVGAAIWQDDGRPWAVFTLEGLVYNAEVSDELRERGL